MKTFKIMLVGLFALVASAQGATFYGANATLSQVNVPATKVAHRENGVLTVAYDEYTVSSATSLLSGDIITLMKLPKGAKLYQFVVQSPELGAAAGDCQLYAGILANGSGVQSANTTLFTGSSGAECGAADLEHMMASDQTIAGNGTVLLAESQVVLNFANLGGTGNGSKGKKIKVWAYYSY